MDAMTWQKAKSRALRELAYWEDKLQKAEADSVRLEKELNTARFTVEGYTANRDLMEQRFLELVAQRTAEALCPSS
jgi:hypothetical protein